MKIFEYKTDFGDVNLPEGFKQKLIGKSYGEQAEFYRITESSSLITTSYGKTDKEKISKYSFGLSDYPYFKGLIVKDGLVVGIMMKEYFSANPIPCLPYQGVCVYYASDSEGSGTKERDDMAYLICI